jgi:hypothetical protein
MEPGFGRPGAIWGGLFLPFFFIYKTMGLASHAFLARKMKLRNEIINATRANDRKKEQAARKKLAELNKKAKKKK